MNTEQAKKISLPDLLARLGYTPVAAKKGGNELWYHSPFRAEAAPSFHTSYLGGKWIWNDFGDTGGTVIDFVLRQQNLTSIKDVLAYLDDIFQSGLSSSQTDNSQPKAGSNLLSFQPQTHREAAENVSVDRQLELTDVGPIRKPLLLSYLFNERHIPPTLAQRYLQEVRYRNLATGKEYFAFGMENQSGGYEIRVASSRYNFKSALKARDITIIAGINAEGSTAHVFEGMTDFLSFLILNRVEESPDDCIIMHSLSSFHRVVAHIRSQGYQVIKTYLDNDKAGQQGTERFKAEFGILLLPQGQAFAPYHDLNDLLRAHQSNKID